MTALVFSVHADDGIFSCGEWIANQVAAGEAVCVLSLCSEAPWHDDAGREWQETLNMEHHRACNSIGAGSLLGGFMDGKWDPEMHADEDEAILDSYCRGFDTVLIPLGIHHPDHLWFADLLLSVSRSHGDKRWAIYEDLPYRVLYPEQALLGVDYAATQESAACAGYYDEKLAACQLYASQWGDDARRCVMAPERIWWVP